MKKWYLYIVECKDGSLYTGITTDLKRRMAEHKEGLGCKYTAAKGFLRLRHKEVLKSRSAAAKREAEIKNWPKAKKKKLIGSLRLAV